MAVRTFLLVLAASAAVSGCGGGSSGPVETAGGEPALRSSTPPSGMVLALRDDVDLFHADPRTLAPLDRRSLRLPFAVATSARSSDGKAIALASNTTAAIELVDLGRLRELRTIDLAWDGTVTAIAWPRPDVLVAVLDGEPGFVVLDPGTGEAPAVEPLEGTILQTAPAPGGLAVLLGPPDGIGPARLVLVSRDGARTVELSSVEAGHAGRGEGESFRLRTLVPALAVEPSGARALVVPPAGPVAEVDLETLAVAMHEIRESVSLLDRLRGWLEPEAEAKLIEGPERYAVWLENGLVAVSGFDYRLDGNRVRSDPAGAYVLDPRRWLRRPLDDRANGVAAAGDALLVLHWPGEDDRASVAVYGSEGRVRFELERRGVWMQATAGLLYLTSNENEYEVVDLATGKTVGRPAFDGPVWLVESSP